MSIMGVDRFGGQVFSACVFCIVSSSFFVNNFFSAHIDYRNRQFAFPLLQCMKML